MCNAQPELIASTAIRSGDARMNACVDQISIYLEVMQPRRDLIVYMSHGVVRSLQPASSRNQSPSLYGAHSTLWMR